MEAGLHPARKGGPVNLMAIIQPTLAGLTGIHQLGVSQAPHRLSVRSGQFGFQGAGAGPATSPRTSECFGPSLEPRSGVCGKRNEGIGGGQAHADEVNLGQLRH